MEMPETEQMARRSRRETIEEGQRWDSAPVSSFAAVAPIRT